MRKFANIILQMRHKKINKSIRKLVANEEKSWIRLREYHSNIAYKLAKAIAKILTSHGTISSPHIKNSNNLINRLKPLDMMNKNMASLDIKYI